MRHKETVKVNKGRCTIEALFNVMLFQYFIQPLNMFKSFKALRDVCVCVCVLHFNSELKSSLWHIYRGGRFVCGSSLSKLTGKHWQSFPMALFHIRQTLTETSICYRERERGGDVH